MDKITPRKHIQIHVFASAPTNDDTEMQPFLNSMDGQMKTKSCFTVAYRVKRITFISKMKSRQSKENISAFGLVEVFIK